MKATAGKSKLTLWVVTDGKRIGKRWARKHGESLSRLVSDYLLRLKDADETPSQTSTIVGRLTGALKGAKVSRSDYEKYLRGKYLNA